MGSVSFFCTVRELELISDWINTHSCGMETGNGPFWMIPQEAWTLRPYQDHFGGKWRFPKYKDGRQWYPSHVKARLLQSHIDRMKEGLQKFYYSGGRNGWTLLYVDIDAHEPWQTDARQLADFLADLFGKDSCMVINSKRGYNLFIKWEYCKKRHLESIGVTEWKKANTFIARLESALKRHTAHFKSIVEVKGKITTSHTDNGTLAKLPFGPHWNHAHEQAFKNLPIFDTQTLQGIIDAIDTKHSSTAKAACGRPQSGSQITCSRGSCDAFNISADDMGRIDEYLDECKTMSWHLNAMKHDPKRYGVKITTEDFRIFMVVLGLGRKYRKAKFGEQMSSAWIKAIWTRLYETGMIDRAYDCSRVAAMRNTMADCGYLNCIDNSFYFDATGETKGKAMEWHLKPEYDVVNTQEDERESIIEEVALVQPAFSWRPVLRMPLDIIRKLENDFWRRYSPPMEEALYRQMAA